MTFDSFDLEDCPDCGCDFVEVSYGSFSQKFCGSTIPGPFTSASPITVKIETDGSLRYPGFSASWTSTYVPSPSTSTSPSPTCNCGEPHRAIRHNRIIGGQDTEVNEYPWQVLIGGCGGSIISRSHILTAAHCMFWDRAQTWPKEFSDITVVTGEHDTTDSNKTEHTILRYDNHPEYKTGYRRYSSRTENYDISIITLSSPLTFSPIASPVCLPSSVTPQYTGQVATVTGWGSTVQYNAFKFKRGPSSSILQEVNVTVLSNKDCQKTYDNLKTDHDFLGEFENGEIYRYYIVKHHLSHTTFSVSLQSRALC